MKSWLKRVRGALGMGLTWAAAWSPVGALIAFVLGFFFTGASMLLWVEVLAALGFVGGGIFSTVLRITEGRRRFDELSLPRFAAWGAVGGVLLGGLASWAGLLGPGLSILDLFIIGTTTVLGAASAAGTLALARVSDDRELLEAGAETAAVGLSAEETRRLLGENG